MKKIIIGDVHGCFEELQALLKKCAYKSDEDHLYFVGDLIHKGPASLEVLKLVRELKGRVILGNHERYFLSLFGRGSFENKEKTPSIKTLISEMGGDLNQWLDYIESFPLYIEENDFLMVHAGLQPNKAPSETNERILTMIRTWDGSGENLERESNPAWYNFYQGEKLVVYGHWARSGLTIRTNTCGLDSGCLYGGHLSALVLPESRIVQVSAKQAYVGIF